MNMPRRIALISEHASSLARAGSVDAGGGQNIYVSQVARYLGLSGCDVTVFTFLFSWVASRSASTAPAKPAPTIRKSKESPDEGGRAQVVRSEGCGAVHGVSRLRDARQARQLLCIHASVIPSTTWIGRTWMPIPMK